MKRNGEKFIFYILMALTYTLIPAFNLEAATLTIGSNSKSSGNKNIPIPIKLNSEPGEKVSAFNFDLSFDTSKLDFKDLTLGNVAKEADKHLSYNQPNPNTVRVVVVGLNQNKIGDGTVLTFTFDILDNVYSGKAELDITKASISDPKGKLLAVDTNGGELHVFK